MFGVKSAAPIVLTPQVLLYTQYPFSYCMYHHHFTLLLYLPNYDLAYTSTSFFFLPSPTITPPHLPPLSLSHQPLYSTPRPVRLLLVLWLTPWFLVPPLSREMKRWVVSPYNIFTVFYILQTLTTPTIAYSYTYFYSVSSLFSHAPSLTSFCHHRTPFSLCM